MHRTEKAALASVGIGLVVLGLKLLAWRVTGSVALYSDALESTINVVAAGAAFWALRVARRPPDANHPYGHDKAEYLSAVFEGVLIVLAALSILREAWLGLMNPRPLDAPALGIAINAAATIINLVWAQTLLRWGTAWRSPALKGDARHIMTDVWTSAGVLAGLVLVPLTGAYWLDPVLAAVVAVNILWTGFGLVREAAGGLMDEAPSEAITARIKDLIGTHSAGAIEAHDIRTREAGRQTFIDFHLVVPGSMPVAEAHAICDRIEAALREDTDGELLISIHVEPEHKAKHDRAAVRGSSRTRG